MKLTVLRYQCDNCGLCCTQTFIKVNAVDVLREPKILGCRRIKVGERVTEQWMLNKLEEESVSHGPCTFHDGKGCTIYGTRPNLCVAFQAGSEACQSLRAKAGLQPLQPEPPQEIEQAFVTMVPESEAQADGVV